MGHTSRMVAASVAAVIALTGMAELASRGAGLSPVAATRVVATPVPTPEPPPAETPEPAGLAPNHCPELDGPGGGVVVTASDPAPAPTDGAVSIPAIGVRAPIVRVGISGGEMVVPRNAADVAWLDGGTFPGATQNAVLAGHHDWSGRLGSFYRLGDLGEGDEISVSMDGGTWTFRVAWICSFDLDTPEAHRIMGPTDVPSVTLVTCGGVFDRRLGTHNQRIVVRAELVETTRAA